MELRGLTALLLGFMTLWLSSCAQSAPDASGLRGAIRVPLRQGARPDALPQPPQPLPPTRRSAAAAAAARGPPRRRRGANAGGISFVSMIDNLRGKSGQGYYVEMAVGSPPQKVKTVSSVVQSINIQSVTYTNLDTYESRMRSVSYGPR